LSQMICADAEKEEKMASNISGNLAVNSFSRWILQRSGLVNALIGLPVAYRFDVLLRRT
jgi:hypothetical protein